MTADKNLRTEVHSEISAHLEPDTTLAAYLESGYWALDSLWKENLFSCNISVITHKLHLPFHHHALPKLGDMLCSLHT